MKYIFIINPIAGVTDKTEHIRKVLDQRTDVTAIVFNTEEAGHETEIMKEMLEIFDDEPVRICICGGSGTLSNAIDAIDIADMNHVEVAYFPCGLTNDFLKNFGEHGQQFENINSIIDGKSDTVDYMRCIIDGDDKKIQNELLFVTVGVAANIERASKRLGFLGGVSPTFMYLLATILAMPVSPSIDYEVIIDGKDYSREYKMIYVGNSPCLGGRFVPLVKNVSCKDGLLNVMLIKRVPVFKMGRYLFEFMHGQLPDKRPEDVAVIRCKEIIIRRKDGKSMSINADGEIVHGNSWKIKVVHDKLRFVVPKNAGFIDDATELVKCMGLC